MGKNRKGYIDMIIVTDHDPKIMHALGNVVDLGPRNRCNYIRCKDIARGLSIKRRFVQFPQIISSLTYFRRRYCWYHWGPSVRNEKYGKEYIYMITLTDHDPKTMHALGNIST